MPVTRAFLKPRSVDGPPQGDFVYVPLFLFFESTTLAGLRAQLDAETQLQQQSTLELYVIEEIEYQVVVTQSGPNPGMLYSAMVWATKAVKV